MFDIEMYWDDSGTHDGSPIAIAACYVADSEQWTHFVRNWDEARKDEGFDSFHMADFMAKPEIGKQPFCEWGQSKKNRVYSRLATIINTRVRIGFGFGVPVPAFDKYVPEHIKREVCPDAFTFAVQSIFSLITEWYVRYGQGKAIQYVFENRPKMGKVRQLWDVLKEHRSIARDLGFNANAPDGFSFQSPKLFKPLQAADMLAWNMNAHMRDVVLRGLPDVENVKPYFDLLRRDRPMRLGFLSEEQVKTAVKTLENTERETPGVRPYLLPRAMRKHLRLQCVSESKIRDNILAAIDRQRLY